LASEYPKNWKLLLKYGRLSTPYKHFTLIIDGEVTELMEHVEAQIGPCFMGLKVWATDENEAFDVAAQISKHLGFNPTGRVSLYETEPQQPPSDNPSAYGATFTPYER